MMGRWTPLEEIAERLTLKVTKLMSQVGQAGLQQSGKTRMALREEVYAALRAGRVYVLDPDKKWSPHLPVPTVADAAVAQG